MLTVFASPARYVQGRNATLQLGAQLTHLGLEGPVFLLASARSAEALGDVWERALIDHPFSVHVFSGECTQVEIDRGIVAARAQGARVVVGVGGGKALDTARGVAAALDLPVVNCPTLASSDAPCSALSVVYAEDGSVERYAFYPRNPNLVLVDTSLVAAAPRRFLVSGMGDALATWYEARSVIEARSPNQLGGATTMAAGALAELCCRTLFADGVDAAAAVDAGVVTPALERIVEANTLLSGLGFESGGLAIAHSVHNGITAAPHSHHMLHGEKVAYGLLVQLIVEGQPREEIEQVVRFCRAVGLPTRLADLGLGDLDMGTARTIAEVSVAPGETAHHEPFEVTSDMILDGLFAADAVSAGVTMG
jgi:glycerol dehydrogenase